MISKYSYDSLVDTNDMQEIETHPWPPFVPYGARVLVLGAFPPGEHRWSMKFYYPNPQNDFWRIMGLLFCGDRNALYDAAARSFRSDDIKELLTAKGIAMADTAVRARRLRGNASDKYLEPVEVLDLAAVLARMPGCRAMGTTGERAAGILGEITGTSIPPIGRPLEVEGWPDIWRLPSSSRAYPLAIEKKAAVYERFFRSAGIELL